jgi:hypothetical protein
MTKPSGSLAILLLAAGLGTLTMHLTTGAHPVKAAGHNGEIHVTKECSQDHGLAGDFCTITSSDLPQINVGSKVYYDQAGNVPAGMLDSNVLLDAGNGNRATGRCTLDLTTALGLCTFVDGTGQLAGFRARVTVDCTAGCRWDGIYRFIVEPPQ